MRLDSITSDSPKQRSGPPNYRSRGTQLRLLVLVFSFMLVLVLIEESRKTKYYEWMWHLNDRPPAAPTSRAEPPPEAAGEPPAGPAAELSPARQDFWSYVTEQLAPEESADLLVCLHQILEGSAEEPSASDRAIRGLQRLESAGQRYLEDAQASLAGQSPAERRAWEPELEQLRSHWEQRLLPALRRLVQGETQVGDLASLRELREQIETRALDSVTDNSVFRTAERAAWLALLRRAAELDDQAQPGQLVSRLQLFRQPDVYRGRKVTLRGTARLGYRVAAGQDAREVGSYGVLWVQPAGDGSSPVVAYCLRMPQGFPELVERRAGEANAMDEDVEITGYFFKRWAYSGQDGLELAPLMLVNSPRWFPAADDAPVAASPTLSRPMLALVVILTLMAGIILAYALYRASSWRGVTERLRPADVVERITQFDTDQIGPSVGDALARLGRQRPEDDA